MIYLREVQIFDILASFSHFTFQIIVGQIITLVTTTDAISPTRISFLICFISNGITTSGYFHATSRDVISSN